MLKIALYEIKKLYRDRRWLLLFIIQPIILIILLGYANHHEPKNMTLAVYDQSPSLYSGELLNELRSDSQLEVVEMESAGELRRQVEQDKVRASLIIDLKPENFGRGSATFIQNVTVPDITARAELAVTKAIKRSMESLESKKMLQGANSGLGSIQLFEEKNTDKNIVFFDYFASAVIVLLIILISLNTSATSITAERIDGTLERIFVTPYTKAKLILGKMIAFSLVSLLLSLVTIFSLSLLFNVNLGALWLVLLITFITAFCAISLGMMISSLTYSIAESIQVATLTFFASMILTRFLFQPESMHIIIKSISAIFPFTYSIVAIREVNLLKMNYADVQGNLFIIAGYAILFIILSTIMLRRRAH